MVLATLNAQDRDVQWLETHTTLAADTLNAEIVTGERPVTFLTAAIISEAIDVDLLNLIYETEGAA